MLYWRKIQQWKTHPCKKKDTYNDVTYKNRNKINDQREKLLIPCEDSIENYKAFKKSYTNENNDLTVIDTSSEEIVIGFEMTQVESKDIIKYNKHKKYY